MTNGYKLVIPLDASGVEDFTPDFMLKVLVSQTKERPKSQTVKFDRSKQGIATFTFERLPETLTVLIGPSTASDDELSALQTLTFNVSGRSWRRNNELKLKPITITAFYWEWWRHWCSVFVIRGVVKCKNGSPVPGAKVCAYDVDWWLFWSSKQKVSCAVTDIHGVFEMKFKWCCGWWPWWWWKHRVWDIDRNLLDRVGAVLKQTPDFRLSQIAAQPNMKIFSHILPERDLIPLKGKYLNDLTDIRKRLLEKLPHAPELERLKIWPWYLWRPWWDCRPDIIFKVTQDCMTPDAVIYSGGIGETRWNIPNVLDGVVIEADDNACCLPVQCPHPPCEGGNCLIIDTVCTIPVANIGGNNNTDTPEGYAYPGAVPVNTYESHRPFAGIIPVSKNPADLLGFDYLEFQVLDGGAWVPLPTGAEVSFYRHYWDTATGAGKWISFPFTSISGHTVVETREHYEANSGMTWDFPGADAWWLSTNWNLLVPMDTTRFDEGVYTFCILGWQESGGALVGDEGVQIPVCGTEDESGKPKPNQFILAFDNRSTDDTGHTPSHNCGAGIHLCTSEPDTHISAVRANGLPVNICGTIKNLEGSLEIDFEVTDTDKHLAFYTLHARWGLNNSKNLLSLPGASVSVRSGIGQTGWASSQTTGNYGTAISQGATPPRWAGGLYTLTIPVKEAFTEPCCYQLVLQAFKRTIVGNKSGMGFGCTGGYYVSVNGNETQFSIGVAICPDN